MLKLRRRDFDEAIRLALREDRAHLDITSRSTIPSDVRISARIIARESGILAGNPVAMRTFKAVDPGISCAVHVREGGRVGAGQTILRLKGNARSILSAERTALNFLGHLSGIATLTQKCVQKTGKFRTTILDARKTLPGLRALEKYAVRVGGGSNYRMDLSGAILIKTNHLKVLGQGTRDKGQGGQVITRAIARARHRQPGKIVEIEVSNLTEFRNALHAQPDIIMLDNWNLPGIRRAVALRASQRKTLSYIPLLESSGNVTLKNVRAIAATGVERISIGGLTDSAPALDLSLRVY